MRLAIAVPSHDQVSAYFANDLARLIRPASVPTEVFFEIGTFVHHAREKLLNHLVGQWGATHILWLDSDMRFPSGAALRLLAHDVDVVAANYVTRVPQGKPTARRDGQHVWSWNATGLEPVDHVGMGVFLMRADVVANIAAPRFWYSTPTETEDVYFCRQLREAGHTIYIDHDLSREVAHVGQHVYREIAA